MSDIYGKEMILDLRNCETLPCKRKFLKEFLEQLCELIDMEREKLCFWDYYGHPKAYEKAADHLKGITAVQFISTSNITIHTIDVQKKVLINVFSCKDFDPDKVETFCEAWFAGDVWRSYVQDRG